VLSRAALLFVGAQAIAACDQERGAPVNAPTNEGTTPSGDAGQSAPPMPNPVALYGVPPIDDGEGSKP
jgi:hypothetical protein